MKKKEKIKVIWKENGKEEEFLTYKGINVEEFLKQNKKIRKSNPIVAVRMDYVFKDLFTSIEKDCIISPVDLTDYTGVKIYKKSLVLLLHRAIEETFKGYKLEVSHSISRGIYCEIIGDIPLRLDMVNKIKEKMKSIIQKDEPFIKKEVTLKQAKNIFQQKGYYDKVRFLQHYPFKKLVIYQCGNVLDTTTLGVVPRTSYLKNFDIVFYSPGIILRFPDKESPDKVPPFKEQSRLFRLFQEHKKWANILEVKNIGELNDYITNGRISEIIKVAEVLHERKIASIADMIYKDIENIRLILIAGPSSSGKTTFAKRLSIHLKVKGLNTIPISLDNYFKNRDEMPVDEKGEYNFEEVDAIDIPLLNTHLQSLFDGHQVMIPKYDFNVGKRKRKGTPLKINRNDILILEGIHGLNDKLTPDIHELQKFKIYVSALTVLNIDCHSRVSTTDVRLLRRIVRDVSYRSYSAYETLKRWPSVRRGENLYIFPFQNKAHVMFNSALIYEIAVLKMKVEKLLKEVPKNTNEYAEAQRLLKLLSYIEPLSDEEIPPTSIIREFIGGSSFKY